MLGRILECDEIEGRPLRLVPTQERHLGACMDWLGQPEIGRYLTGWCAQNPESERKWYERAAADPNGVYWSIEVGEQHIGQTAIAGIDWVARTGTTGIFIGERDWWGRGVATRVMGRRNRFAFEQLNLQALYTQIFVPNTGSLKAAQKNGYREYGRRPYARYVDGEYLDGWLGVLDRDEWQRLTRGR